jgi:SAM-dependent methyltransferase
LRFDNCTSGDPAFYASLMKNRGGYHREKWEFDTVARLLAPGATVLDVGCGRGDFAAAVSNAVYRGIEISDYAVEEARKLGRDVRKETLEQQQPGSFDAVTLFQVVEHVDDPVGLVRKSVEVLKPGGMIAVAVPDSSGFIGFTKNMTLNYPPHHLTWWDGKALENLGKEVGLARVEVSTEPLVPEHFLNMITAILMPRTDNAFDFSWREYVLRRSMRVLFRLRDRSNIPLQFARGHTILMIGYKPA